VLNSRSYDDLTPEFRDRAIAVVEGCKARGLQMVVASTLRDLESQASLFRMNRPWGGPKGIKAKIDKFRERGFDQLADVIQRVGPQNGNGGGVVTNAGPGESWHNYGRAMDAYPLVHGKLATDRDVGVWRIYGEEAAKAGLEWAGNWTSFRELPHVQLGVGSNPLKSMPRPMILNILSRWL
jgi:peptidoglycan LD-endopeptidase CwlK